MASKKKDDVRKNVFYAEDEPERQKRPVYEAEDRQYIVKLSHDTVKKIRGLIVFTILFVIIAIKIEDIAELGEKIFSYMSPFLVGACIAFVVNAPMKWMENKVLGGKRISKSRFVQKIKRPVSMLFAFVLILGILFAAFFLVVPELISSIEKVGTQAPAFFEKTKNFLIKQLDEYPAIVEELKGITIDWQKMTQTAVNFLKNAGSMVISGTYHFAKSMVSVLFSLFVSVFFAVYILLQKETLSAQVKKVMRAYMKESHMNRIIRITVLTNTTFSNFLTGQCLEAIILGLMFVITMSIFGFPYPVMIGAIIGITALIPVFGAFLGCAIGFLFILMVNPVQALWFLLMFIILQQLEGNFIYPHVVGGAVGLPAMWVLVAVTIGGKVMGVAGMLLFIPFVSVLYAILREIVNHRVKRKEAAKALMRKPEAETEAKDGTKDGAEPEKVIAK